MVSEPCIAYYCAVDNSVKNVNCNIYVNLAENIIVSVGNIPSLTLDKDPIFV